MLSPQPYPRCDFDGVLEPLPANIIHKSYAVDFLFGVMGGLRPPITPRNISQLRMS
jgi:hypothetical protein